MKQSFFLVSLLFLFIISSFYTTRAARLLTPKQGKDEMMVDGLFQVGHSRAIEEDSLNLGLEDCENGDEDCLKRRMISEAHLDYIYTRHHKP
ncbi:putative phytosulfokines 6 [Magnolia sinica]|uniref:putative phytosulfokines 6 n=1 Tax=Magnolia sinica TaxID=86752 RepID=UPI002657E76E|nr:putative phytosulfokines 6 [Magnolia sinica]